MPRSLISKLFSKRTLAIALLCLLLLMVLWLWGKSCSAKRAPAAPYKDYPAVVTSVKATLKLATAEVYHEQTLTDTLHNTVVVMVVQSRSLISFDLDQMPVRAQGDTLYLQLPPEIITHYETGLTIVDHYALRGTLFPKPITADEENRLKKEIPARLTDLLYRQGYVQRARESAVQQVRDLLGTVYPYLIVTDQFPQGVRNAPFPDTLPPLRHQDL